MRDIYLFYTADTHDVVVVSKDEVLKTLFAQEMIKRKIKPWHRDHLRCMTTVLVNEIHRYFIDRYGLD